MAERIRPIEQMLELSEEESMSPELLDTQVQKAQEQLLQLRRQADLIEKQKRARNHEQCLGQLQFILLR